MINIKRILCPTDLSPYSGNAVRYAMALARAHGDEFILLYCTDDLDGMELLRDSVSEYIDPSDSRCRLMIAPADHVDEEIMKQAQVECVDLTIMRSRRRPHRAALLGSTAESVSRSAPCPVLVMHSDEQDCVAASSAQIELKRVL